MYFYTDCLRSFDIDQIVTQEQCNPVNTVTNKPKKFGRINEGFLQENVKPFSQAAKKVAVITRWPYYQGGRKAGFHCT